MALAGAVTLFAAAVLWFPGASDGRTLVWAGYEHYSPVGDESREGFDVAAEIAGPEGVVITDWNNDGALWMYAEAGVFPLTALVTSDVSVDATFPERAALLGATLGIGIDPVVDELVEKYRVRAVYLDETTYAGSVHQFTREALLNVPGLTEVYHEGTVSVFEVHTDG